MLFATLFDGTAEASAITSFTAGTTQTNGGAFTVPTLSAAAAPGADNTFLSPFSLVHGDNPPSGTSTTASTNYVNLSATVTDIHEPMSLEITVADNTEFDEYFFTVKVTHNAEAARTHRHPIGPVTFELTDDSLDVSTSNITFDYTSNQFPRPTSTYNGVDGYDNSAAWSGQSLTFGGLQGGGGEFYFGEEVVFTFSVDIPSGLTGTFFLQMTPNPEPASFFLAGLGLVGGGFLYKRRRKTRASVVETEKAG